MTSYVPDHLVRCSICRDLFSDARRLHCGCVYCYACCLTLVQDDRLRCLCSASTTRRFQSSAELAKALVVDTVVNDLVRQRRKNERRVVHFDTSSVVSSHLTEETIPSPTVDVGRLPSSGEGKAVALAQPPCTLCAKRSLKLMLCEHCQSDICEVCLDKHYALLSNTLEKKWIECEKKMHQVNAHVSLSHHTKTTAIGKLSQMRKTIEERTKNIQLAIENHQKTLARHIDQQIEQLEQIIETNRRADDEYRTMRELLPRLIKEETNTSKLVTFLQKVEELLRRLKLHEEKMKEFETKVPYLSIPEPSSINLSEIFGELKFDDRPTSQPTSGDTLTPERSSTGFQRGGRFARRPLRPRGGMTRGGFAYPTPMNNNSYRPNTFYRGNERTYAPRFAGRCRYPTRGRLFSRPISMRPVATGDDDDLGIYPNQRHRWFIDFKEIPHFLCVFEQQLFISDDHGQLVVYDLPPATSTARPALVRTGELFSKNSALLLEALTVYEFAIVVYVRRFEQRSNEIEHTKLLKAGLPIMSGEQGRCNDHGGMIYLFSHRCEEIDGVYQAHPIRTLLADPTYRRLWALNPMDNYVYSYAPPQQRLEVHKRLQDEEILLHFSSDTFEPSLMFQSTETIGLVDAERHLFRLYAKNEPTRLITSYQNVHQPQWKITDGLLFRDNRTLLRLTEDKFHNRNDIAAGSPFGQAARRRRLIELTADGQEKRQFQANTVYSMTLGPNDELILGFAVRGDRGLIHCY